MLLLLYAVAVATATDAATLKVLHPDLSVQLKALETAGYNVSKLDANKPLQLFLDTWLTMESVEGGVCCSDEYPMECAKPVCFPSGICISRGKRTCWRRMGPKPCENNLLESYQTSDCCTGWSKVMGICTSDSWYNGPDAVNIRATVQEIEKSIKS